MSETLKYRRETAAEQFEQTERYQAMSFLNQLGITKKLNEIKLFHGRASDDKGDWRINPAFNNAGNNTKNRNINKIPALNTSDYETASRFAQARARRNSTEAEVHRIMSDDPDAVIIDKYGWNNLDKDQNEVAKTALNYTLFNITEGSPLSFENRNALNNLKLDDFTNQHGMLFLDDIPQVSQRLGLDSSIVEQIGSAINTAHYIGKGLLNPLCQAFLDDELYLTTTIKNKKEIVPINKEYLANWFRKNHVVGYKERVRSYTLGYDTVDNYLLFDLEKVNTDVELEQRKYRRNRRLGQIALAASKNNLKNHGNLAEVLSQNLYIEPEEIIELAKQTPGYKEIFEADAGNWEKFTLEEHTETTLRVLDHNYADSLPAPMLPLIRMALLVHDLGKPEAVRRGEKANQKHYNDVYAEHFLKQNNVDEPTIKLIRSMIGEGMDWTKRLMLQPDQANNQQFNAFCVKTMQDYLGTDQIDRETINGFKNMLGVIQTCDSAAYTTMAVTRSNEGYHKNYGSFNSSFEPYTGLTGRRVKIRSK